MKIKLDNRYLNTGEEKQFLHPIGKRHDGTNIGLPLVGIMGEKPGPVLGITAGVHGDEYEGPEALRLIIDEIDPKELRGGIICTPHANMSALEIHHRSGWIDRLDMNRSFPGKNNGYITERAADIVVKEIIEQSDYFLDLHSAGLSYDLEAYVGFNDTEGKLGEESYELAKAFGVPLLYSSTPFPNVMRLEAHKRNIPAILVESGGEGRCKTDRLSIMKTGISNVMKYLGMIDGELQELPNKYTVIKAPSYGEFLHSPASGYLRGKVGIGEKVKKGDLLGEIVDVFGNKIISITSPLDGIILIVRTIPSIRLGDWAFSIVEITNEGNNQDFVIESHKECVSNETF
ncbi:succinylglutamate desuccinylase [Oceanobacillus oncorhynchi subsp. incaldanensis]|uniref:succinylglutamate desuccinylase/aspartoacylase family protein n=1 Tax=Oceanobacillus oncorhynchi TaxID=545501 RepID=UPI001B208313|nr:succinylglutamate desuccinylase/aspartoacylase family protein [Oceanobacillus oncorhynchi]GIO18068.1 succinylglutamate desuccinylase [Oceanobacillus oncorhynchi subsp. incaldanensis]